MSDDLDSYYRDHWLHVEEERMARYEAMFQWRDGYEALIAPAGIAAGQVVADYGCGPGGLAIELARRVGPSGQVLAVDINRDFLTRTRAVADELGLGDRVDTRLMEAERIPVEDGLVDRVVCKNVLEYVPDPEATIAEFHRIVKPGGVVHVSDSDWGGVVLEPLGERFTRLMSAASIAFRTPLIARRLYGMFRRVGFTDIRVQIIANADITGGLRGVIYNMASYARTSGKIGEAEIAAFVADVDRAVEERTFLALLPQFLVTGRR
ncbi:MAG TPA: methyltransferase domain-containing protein [Pseudomonadales bacterium]